MKGRRFRLAAGPLFALAVLAVTVWPQGAAAGLPSTFYGWTGYNVGNKIAFSLTLPAGSQVAATNSGSLDTGNDPLYVGWDCYYAGAWHAYRHDYITSRLWVISPTTTPFASLGIQDFDRFCRYTFSRAGSAGYHVDVDQFTYYPPADTYVNPYPTGAPNPTATPVPTYSYATPAPTPTPTVAPTPCMSQGPTGPGYVIQCPAPSATPNPLEQHQCSSGSWDWNGGNPCRDAAGVVQTWQVVAGHRYKATFILSFSAWNSSMYNTTAQVFYNEASRCGATSGLADVKWGPTGGGSGCSWDPAFTSTSYQQVVADDARNVSDFTGTVNVAFHFDFSSWPGGTGYLTVALEDLGWVGPYGSPPPYVSPAPGATAAPYCPQGYLCDSNGNPLSSTAPGGGTGTGGGGGTGDGSGIGNGTGLGPNTLKCISTNHPVGPISGECKAFMLDYPSVGVCTIDLNPVSAITWVGCMLSNVGNIAGDGVTYLANIGVDLFEPGVGLGNAIGNFNTAISGRVPFSYVAGVVSGVQGLLAAPAGHAMPFSVTLPGIHGIGAGTYSVADFASAVPSWVRTAEGGLVYVAGALMLFRVVRSSVGGGGNGD